MQIERHLNSIISYLDWAYVVELVKRNQLTLEDEDIYEKSNDFGDFLRMKMKEILEIMKFMLKLHINYQGKEFQI